MSEVAEYAGVSVSTVSHVINQTRPVSDQLSARVRTAMRELGYQQNRLARSLRRGETNTIGVILPDSANPFFAEVARGIEDNGFEQGYSVIICNSDNNQEKEQFYTSVLFEKQVDGIIFLSTGDSTDLISTLQKLQELERPVVIVDRVVPGAYIDSVMTDNTEGGWLATSHLIQLEHRRIGCISGPSALSPSADRLTGYRKALAENDIPVDESLIVGGDFHYQGGYTNTINLLRSDNAPSAIFALNDLMAVGAIAAARKMGKRVPEELSVIGFDDIALASYTCPQLTTVAQPKYEMGILATNLLFDRIRNSSLHPRFRTLETSLVIRKSTASPGK